MSPSNPQGLPWWLRWQRVCLQCGRPRVDPCIRKTPWRRKQQPTPVLMPGKSHDGGAWPATVQGVAKSRTQLSDFTLTFTFRMPKLLWVERKLKNLLSCKYSLFLMWEKIGDSKVRIKISEDGAKSHKNHFQRPVLKLSQEKVLLCQAEFQNYQGN